MAPSSKPVHPSAPAVDLRWEWRTFGDLDDGADADDVALLRAAAATTSDETYLLSAALDPSVKVRGGLLDLKVLRHVDDTGLQLWAPTMKAPFPIDEAAVAMAYDALGLQAPRRPRYTFEELLEETGAREDVRAVDVHKVRHRTVLAGCMVEYTELTADGRTTMTIAVESPDRELVTATVARLGLSGRPNTCVAQGLRSLLDWRPTRYAVIDVGTNSVKVTAGDRSSDGTLSTELDTALVTRLGEGLAEAGELTDDAMRRTADAVTRWVRDLRRKGPIEIVAVGTAGLRQAPNRASFVDLVLDRCGVAVQVISGPEEARLAYQAAVSTLPRTSERLLVFDSGGGSTQFTSGTPDGIDDQFSIDLGAVRITERFGLSGAVDRDTVDAALVAIEAELGRLAGRPRPDAVIAIGGTSTNLAAVRHALATYDPDAVHGTVIDLPEVDRQIELYRSLPAPRRREIVGLQPARAEVILAGACIVRAILTVTGQDAVTVSDRGLRHGVAAERFGERRAPRS